MIIKTLHEIYPLPDAAPANRILVLLLQVKDTVNQDINSTTSHCCVALANYSTVLFPHVQNRDNDNSLYYLPYMVTVRIQKGDEHQRPSRGAAT